MQPLRSWWTQRVRGILLGILVLALAIVGADVAVNYAYGSVVQSMAFNEAIQTVTDHVFGWLLFVIGSWVVLVAFFSKKARAARGIPRSRRHRGVLPGRTRARLLGLGPVPFPVCDVQSREG